MSMAEPLRVIIIAGSERSGKDHFCTRVFAQ
jgi:predicted alpha/beta hydrolase family esterase